MDMSKEVKKVLNEIESALAGKIEPEVQGTLADLTILLHDIEQTQSESLLKATRVALKALLSPDPEVKLAERIRDDIRVRLGKGLLQTPALLIVIGLGSLLYLMIPFLIWLVPKLADAQTIFGLKSSEVYLVAIFGAVGSVVSIMVRIEDFSSLTDVNKAVLALTGFFKPIIGTAFALFIYASIGAGLIPVEIVQGKEVFFFMATAFLAGFSERWAKDVATKTEEKLQAVTP
jgi:hypothetical protein